MLERRSASLRCGSVATHGVTTRIPSPKSRTGRFAPHRFVTYSCIGKNANPTFEAR